MKKILLLSALAFSALASQAVTFTVTVGGKEIENGAEVESTEIQETVWGGAVPTTYQLMPEVYASTSESVNVKATCTNTTQNYEDWMPGLMFCWPIECLPNISVPGAIGIAEGTMDTNPVSLQVDSEPWDGFIDKPFTVSCNVRLQAEGGDSFSFSLTMIYDPASVDAGVDGVEADNAPAEYFDLAGRRVLNPDKGQILIERRGAKVAKVIL